MKSVLITFDQAHYENILDELSKMNIRGYTSWKDVEGKGSADGFPHLGTHAWPSVNNAIITIIPAEKVDSLLDRLKELDEESQNLGLRAFVWNVEKMI